MNIDDSYPRRRERSRFERSDRGPPDVAACNDDFWPERRGPPNGYSATDGAITPQNFFGPTLARGGRVAVTWCWPQWIGGARGLHGSRVFIGHWHHRIGHRRVALTSRQVSGTAHRRARKAAVVWTCIAAGPLLGGPGVAWAWFGPPWSWGAPAAFGGGGWAAGGSGTAAGAGELIAAPEPSSLALLAAALILFLAVRAFFPEAGRSGFRRGLG